MSIPTPTPEDHFSFGLWTVLAGPRPVRRRHPRRDGPGPRAEKLAEIGADGANFHDDDLVPFGAGEATREDILDRFRQGLADTEAAACMTNYLVLRDKVRAFRADPEVHEALEAARVPELAVPTLVGETWAQLREEAAPDVEALAARGMGFERLDQLALEHLYGVRG